MVQLNKVIVFALCAAVLSVIFAGGASAKEVLYNGTIDEGDGYQINNYVIDVTDVFTDARTASFYVYNKDDLVKKPLLGVDDSFSFDFEDSDTVEVTLLSVKSGVLNRAEVSITITDDDEVHTEGIVDGGHNKAVYSGTPVLQITKSVDKSEIGIEDSVRVTVTVKNTGDDTAKDVVFSNPQQEGFVLKEVYLEETGPMSIDVDESKTIFVYILKPTDSGNFLFRPTTATFSNNAEKTFPQASSNKPAVFVNAPKKSAVLEISTNVDLRSAERNDEVTGTIGLKNTGDASAEGVWIEVLLPEDVEYVSGDSKIEVIAGVPKIYMESFGIGQEKEFKFVVKPTSVGTYSIGTELSYKYNNGVNPELQEASAQSTTDGIEVVRGKTDFLFEQPVYVYLLPLLLIAAAGAWVFHRHKQYKF